MLTWTLHDDKRGLAAAGKTRQYWLCETQFLKVQENAKNSKRDKPIALFRTASGGQRHDIHDCYDSIAQAVMAAEALENAETAA